MAHLEPRRSPDPGEHYLVHACRYLPSEQRSECRTFESSDVYIARRMAVTLRARGWTTLIFKSLPGAAGSASEEG